MNAGSAREGCDADVCSRVNHIDGHHDDDICLGALVNCCAFLRIMSNVLAGRDTDDAYSAGSMACNSVDCDLLSVSGLVSNADIPNYDVSGWPTMANRAVCPRTCYYFVDR